MEEKTNATGITLSSLGVTLASAYLIVAGVLGLLISLLLTVLLAVLAHEENVLAELSTGEQWLTALVVLAYFTFILMHTVVGVGLLRLRSWAWTGAHAITAVYVALGLVNLSGQFTITIETWGIVLVAIQVAISIFLGLNKEYFNGTQSDPVADRTPQ